MAFVHGKVSEITVDGDDLSAYCNNISFNRTVDSHDVTTFGKASHCFAAGLLTGEATISGIYDNAATGPRDVLRPLLVAGAPVPVVYSVEGAGMGLPSDTVDVIITAYNETTAVADMVMWEATLQLTDDVVTADGS